MSFVSAISHKDVLSRIAQSSLRTSHNAGCGCYNAMNSAKKYIVLNMEGLFKV